MNEQRDRRSSAGGSPARGSGPGSWLGLATQMMLLPFRLFGWGLQLMEQPGEGLRRLAGDGSGGQTGGAGLSPTPGVAPAWASPLPPPPSPLPSTGTGSAATPARAVSNLAATKIREERHMACDMDLKGSDLKIIEYTIVSVDPNIQRDKDYIIQETQTISTTQDMTENGFIAWVIAMYFQKPDHKRLTPGQKQYLRVCYCVKCRMPIPEEECCKTQNRRLLDINRTLEALVLVQGGSLEKGEETSGGGQVGQGGSQGGALTPTTGRGGRKGGGEGA